MRSFALGLAIAFAACGPGREPNVLPPPDAGIGDASPLDAEARDAAITDADARDGARDASARSDPPPSTGREMPAPPPPPRLTAQEARQLVEVTMNEARKPGSDCDKTVPPLVLALSIVSPVLSREYLDEYKYIAVCAHKLKRWALSRRVNIQLINFDPNYEQPSLLPRAEVGMSNYAGAVALVDKLVARYPKDPGLPLAKAHAQCGLTRWAECLAAANAAHALKADEEEIRALKANALMHLGKLDDAGKELDAMKDAPQRLKDELAVSRLNKVVLDPVAPDTVPLGLYHLFGEVEASLMGALVTVDVYNIADKDRQIRVETGIPGVTESSSRTFIVAKGARQTVRFAPPLKLDVDINTIRADRQVQLNLRVLDTDGDKVLYENPRMVTLLPRDALPLERKLGVDVSRPTFGNIAAWVTPNSKVVEPFLTAAKKRHPKQIFAGEQAATIPQVKAIFDELHERGVTYVMDPRVASGLALVQRTRLPADVLASTNAQCLEGTIFFATMFEAIGLRPILVIVPGHAFVGWHATAKDAAPAGAAMFVETTMVGGGDLEKAMRVGAERVRQEAAAKHFDRGVSHLLELEDLRRAGYKPQPVD
jgi:tetratricopeptide (TPR) repeat protein